MHITQACMGVAQRHRSKLAFCGEWRKETGWGLKSFKSKGGKVRAKEGTQRTQHERVGNEKRRGKTNDFCGKLQRTSYETINQQMFTGAAVNLGIEARLSSRKKW